MKKMKNIKIIVLPKFVVKEYNLYYSKESSVNHLFISINSYGCSKAIFPISTSLTKHRIGQLFLIFDDINPLLLYHYNNFTNNKLESFHLFSSLQAIEIIQFIKKYIYQKNIKTIFINCEAGVSRSAAVALALDVIINNVNYNDSIFFKSDKYLPNKFVFNSIISAYKRNYY